MALCGSRLPVSSQPGQEAEEAGRLEAGSACHACQPGGTWAWLLASTYRRAGRKTPPNRQGRKGMGGRQAGRHFSLPKASVGGVRAAAPAHLPCQAIYPARQKEGTGRTGAGAANPLGRRNSALPLGRRLPCLTLLDALLTVLVL